MGSEAFSAIPTTLAAMTVRRRPLADLLGQVALGDRVPDQIFGLLPQDGRAVADRRVAGADSVRCDAVAGLGRHALAARWGH